MDAAAREQALRAAAEVLSYDEHDAAAVLAVDEVVRLYRWLWRFTATTYIEFLSATELDDDPGMQEFSSGSARSASRPAYGGSCISGAELGSVGGLIN